MLNFDEAKSSQLFEKFKYLATVISNLDLHKDYLIISEIRKKLICKNSKNSKKLESFFSPLEVIITNNKTKFISNEILEFIDNTYNHNLFKRNILNKVNPMTMYKAWLQ